MKNSRLLKLNIAIVFLLCLTFSACQKKSKKTTLLLDWWANPNHVPVYAGIELGIFKKFGIDLEVLNLNEPPDSLVYLISGKTDLSLYYMPHTLRAFAQNRNFRIVGKLHDCALNTFLTREDSGIESIQDFQDKSFGIFPDGITMALFNILMSEKHNIVPGDFKTLQFDLSTILYTKSVDIITGVYWNIEPFQLKSKGVKTRSFKWGDLGFPDYPELVFLANSKFLENHPGFSKQFRKALQKSIEYCCEFPAEAFDLYLKQNPDKSSSIEWEKEAWKATVTTLAKSQNFSRDKWEKFYLWMSDNSLISKSFEVDDVLESTSSIK